MMLPPPFGKTKNTVNVVIETPCKSRNKFSYDEETGLYKLSKVLPYGLNFPFTMGFIPHTKGGDGDPLDVLLLMDELTYPGCYVECRLLGLIKAKQKEKGKGATRNDRLIGVPMEMPDVDHIRDLSDLNKRRLEDIIRFFEYYNAAEGNQFIFKGIANVRRALQSVRDQQLG